MREEGDRVAMDGMPAAACYLPGKPAGGPSDRSLGLRHRAGLGMTEESDAIAVVVSEETGGISILPPAPDRGHWFTPKHFTENRLAEDSPSRHLM